MSFGPIYTQKTLKIDPELLKMSINLMSVWSPFLSHSTLLLFTMWSAEKYSPLAITLSIHSQAPSSVKTALRLLYKRPHLSTAVRMDLMDPNMYIQYSPNGILSRKKVYLYFLLDCSSSTGATVLKLGKGVITYLYNDLALILRLICLESRCCCCYSCCCCW